MYSGSSPREETVQRSICQSSLHEKSKGGGIPLHVGSLLSKQRRNNLIDRSVLPFQNIKSDPRFLPILWETGTKENLTHR
jgi:hypothetical protein